MDINVYIDQLDNHCDAYSNKNDKNVPLFLVKIGHDLFSLLKGLHAHENVKDQLL